MKTYRVVESPPAEIAALMAPWMKLAKIVRGKHAGAYVFFDSRNSRPPCVWTAAKASDSVRHGDVVVDIGANVGGFSIECARKGARVLAYEPNPLPAACLRYAAIDRITVVEAAVTAHSGTVELMIAEDSLSTSSSVVKPPRQSRSLAVDAVTFADAVQGASVIKIDAEGCEYQYGLGIDIDPKLQTIAIAFHRIDGIDWRTEAQAIVDRFLKAGFRVVKPAKLASASGGSFDAEGVWTRRS